MAQARRIKTLDGLRGIAVALIVIMHMTSNPTSAADGDLARLYLFIVRHFWFGVDIFFALSGFLITGILLRSRSAPGYFRTFYRNRAFRILPVAGVIIGSWYWVAVPILRHMHAPAVIASGIETGIYRPLYGQLWYFLFLQNMPWAYMPVTIGHLWTLAIEEQFYLLWPLIVMKWSRNLRTVCMGVIIAAAASRVALYFLGVDQFQKLTVSRMDELAMGALLAVFAHEGSSTRAFRKFGMLAALCLAGIVVVEVIQGRDSSDPLMNVFGTALWGVVGAGLVSVARHSEGNEDSPWRRLFTYPALVSLGKYSYALYLIHYPVYLGLHQLIRGRFGFWAETVIMLFVGGAVSYALARASWLLVESPMLALRDRFASGKPTAIAATSVA